MPNKISGGKSDDSILGYAGSDSTFGSTGSDKFFGGARRRRKVYTNYNTVIVDYKNSASEIRVTSGNLSKATIFCEDVIFVADDEMFTVRSCGHSFSD